MTAELLDTVPGYDAAGSLHAITERRHIQRTRGIKTLKLQDDLDRYMEAFEQGRPEIVVEVGTRFGGSAMWFAERVRHVITVDIDVDASCHARRVWPDAPIQYVRGDGASLETVNKVRDLVSVLPGAMVMVVLDDLHTAAHVARELEPDMWPSLVTPGQFLVVEDGVFDFADLETLNRLMLADLDEGGPLTAISERLAGRPGWARATEIESMSTLSHHPAGFWRRDDYPGRQGK